MNHYREWSVIVPFSKPAMLQTTLNNVLRQHKAGHELCLVLVANGEAKGIDVPDMPFPVIKLESARHQSSARNIGLDFVQLNKLSERIAMFDCDDYYGPGYLTEQRSNMAPGRLVGKRMHFVSDEHGLFAINLDWKGGFTNDITGSCYCLYTEDAKDRFPFIPIGEDTLFAYEWESHGEVYASSPFHYCYIRGHLNTWSANVRQRLVRAGHHITPLGSFSPAVINGESKPWASEIHRPEQPSNAESPSFQAEP